MRQIQMVDLKAQYEHIQTEVNAAVQQVMTSSAFINGPAVQQFQRHLEEYLDIPHVIPCANGTDALQIALMALGLRAGDEVITPDFTFSSTVEVVGLLQLKHVLVDVDPLTFCMDPQAVEAAITPRTKAIIPVHLFGQCAPMETLRSIAKAHGLYVVEDNAQALGAVYTMQNGDRHKSGTMGHIGTTSFFPSKNLGAYGDGGALFTDDDDLARTIRSIVNHGMGERYYYDRLGVNSRLDSLQAAVLDVKLRHLDDYTSRRRSAADFYHDHLSGLEGVTLPSTRPDSSHVFHQYTLKVEGLDQFAMQRFMNEKGIPAMIYYPVPLHTQKAYEPHRYRDKDFPVTNALCQSVISLPMHTELEEDQLQYICAQVTHYLENIHHP